MWHKILIIPFSNEVLRVVSIVWAAHWTYSQWAVTGNACACYIWTTHVHATYSRQHVASIDVHQCRTCAVAKEGIQEKKIWLKYDLHIIFPSVIFYCVCFYIFSYVIRMTTKLFQDNSKNNISSSILLFMSTGSY